MWGEALSLLEQADRLHRQFFRVAGAESAHTWEPPVDVVESEALIKVHVALPGVSPETITILMEPGGVVVSALRAFPCRETGAHIHRIEIPYGRFERRIALPLHDPYMPIELVEKDLVDGVLTLTFRRKEGA
jgi:HSP20 family molecular chaperone IbpA